MTMRSRTWEVEVLVTLPKAHGLTAKLLPTLPAMVRYVLTESLHRDRAVTEVSDLVTRGSQARLRFRVELPPLRLPEIMHKALARCLSKILAGTQVETRWWTSRQAADPVLAARRTRRRYRGPSQQSLYAMPLAGHIERVPPPSERRNDPATARDEHCLRGALWLTDHQPQPIAANDLEQAAPGCLEDPERLLNALTLVLPPSTKPGASLALTYAHTENPSTTPPEPAAVIVASRRGHHLATALLPHHDLPEQVGTLLGLKNRFKPEELQAYIIDKDKV